MKITLSREPTYLGRYFMDVQKSKMDGLYLEKTIVFERYEQNMGTPSDHKNSIKLRIKFNLRHS